jgi:hypothetical protein
MVPPPSPTRRCCNEETCPRVVVSCILEADDPIEGRVDTAASLVAQTCSDLNSDELEGCFTGLFGIPAECLLFERFRAAYQTERDALHGERLVHEVARMIGRRE